MGHWLQPKTPGYDRFPPVAYGRHGRNNGGATSERETLDKTHNNQSLNPNGATATDYKGSRDMGTPLDAPLLGSDMIHRPKATIRCHNT
jgi:hypothetical protein